MTGCPTQPRLVDGLVLAPLDHGLVFDGAARRQVLRGPAATALLPRLLPLLDGTRALPTLAAALGDIAPATVTQAVTLLWERGLVEDGSGPAGRHAGTHPDVAAFVGRLVGSTSHNRSGDEALGRLSAAEVVVVADGPAAACLASELTAAAIGRVRIATIDMLERARPRHGTGPLPLVVALEPSAVSPGLHRLDDWCAEAGVGWLRTAAGTGVVEIGPHFDGRSGACYRCFAADRPTPAPTDPEVVAGQPEPRPAPQGGVALTDPALVTWASLVAIEICYLTARIGRTVATAGVTTLDLGSWRSHREPAIRRPGCPRCCPLAPGEELLLSPSYRREQAGVLAGPESIELADHRPRPTRAWPLLRLTVRPRAAHPCPQWAGGPGDSNARADRLSAARLNPDLLACVLARAVAVAEPGQDPAPGAPAIPMAAISPVQAYVFVHRIVDLGDGWHWWHSREGVFIPVHTHTGDESTAALTIARGTGRTGPVRTPGAVIALTATLAQLEESHGPVGHRLAHLATGRVAHALVDGLARAGMPARLRPAPDDQAVAAALGLDPAVEPVTALIDLPAPRVSP